MRRRQREVERLCASQKEQSRERLGTRTTPDTMLEPLWLQEFSQVGSRSSWASSPGVIRGLGSTPT